jgi:hypothetical protein
VDLGGGRNVQIKDKQRHGNREDAVTQGGEALQAAALDSVVEIHHVPSLPFLFAEMKFDSSCAAQFAFPREMPECQTECGNA